MAEKGKLKSQNSILRYDRLSPADAAKRKRKWLIWGSTVAVCLGGLIWLLWQLPCFFYYNNSRLQFKNLDIDSTGYWQKNSDQLLERIDLKYGDNMFEIDITEIRRRLETIPSIERAEVRFILPDTLKFKITERIPRAALYSQNSGFVVDKDCQTMQRAQSSAGNQRLPVIKSLRNRKNENITDQLRPALKLIMSALSNYPEIAIQQISLATPGEMSVQLYYRERKKCLVLFPAAVDEDYNYLLSVLQTTILRSGANWMIYDLRYRGSVSGR